MKEFLARYMPTNASAHGDQLDQINALVHWLMLILLVGWGLYFVYVLYRFRASKNPRADYGGVKSKLSTYSEAGIVVVEAVLLIGFSIPAWSRWVAAPPRAANPMQIRIVAEQFAWNVHYPGSDGVFGRTAPELVTPSNPIGLDRDDPRGADDILSINQLHLEKDRPVTIRLSSKDVIHSFSLPTMRVKQDTIPGMEIPVHFTPVQVSGDERWEIACAQLCGLGHYRMRGFLTVHDKEDFQAWLAANAPVPQPAT